jgi:hypothetical protein
MLQNSVQDGSRFYTSSKTSALIAQRNGESLEIMFMSKQMPSLRPVDHTLLLRINFHGYILERW